LTWLGVIIAAIVVVAAMGIGTFDTAEMLEAINRTPRPRKFLRERLFGGRVRTFISQYVLADFMKGKRHITPFVSRYVQGVLQEKLPFDRRTYTPPRLAPMTAWSGDEAIDELAPGEVIGALMDPEARLAQRITLELNQQDNGMTRREEWMLAKLLSTGVIPIVGQGVSDEIDLNHTLTDTLLADARWGQADADIIGNIREWKTEVIKSSGLTPDTLVLGQDASAALMKDDTIIQIMRAVNIQYGQMIQENLPNGAEYLGHLVGVDVFAYPEWYIDDDTQDLAPMIATDAAILFPSASRNPEAKMLYGSWYNVKEQRTYVGERIPRKWVEEGPNVEYVQLQAFPLPFVPDADSWLTAVVL